ncbi:chemotaxis response regulator protein-glutamate methylesterase [Halobacteriovorax sp. HLS]|uniref:protein-glutamate methylesterase/protein-glutamine glutaminase n=1 Tax=Halobacteriovorax sp. HLS TaxID=2234000 RepID=UPI000FDAB689|nr:chemotaxis response regulator protein-glutamate methylesterase [Halobacteriovorax sp. HLS]
MRYYSEYIQKEYYFKVGNECFITLNSSSGKSCGLLVNTIELQSGHFEEFISKASSELGQPVDKLTLKVVGAVSFIQLLKVRASNYAFESVKLVERFGNFEIIYFPSEGKLRVTKPEKEDNEPKIVKVLIVDDSKTIRNLLSRILSKSSRIEVVATAEKPSEVEELIKKFQPDVITLDIHMPEMNGVELLKLIQPKYNIPTIMITSVSIQEGPLVLEALDSGAFDYIQKPKMEEIQEVAPIMIEKVVEASKFKSVTKSVHQSSTRSMRSFNKDCTIVIGSSTGGTTALKDILSRLPNSIPPIVIVQHIPAVFSKAFADRINGICPFRVKEAEDGEPIVADTVYIAPGGMQMKIKQKHGKPFVEITDDAPVNRFKPSVDYLFDSCEKMASKENLIAVMLTGMGRDGAKGMKKLRDLGALTIAQNEESCVVFGMPKAVIELDGASYIVHKDEIADKMVELSVKFENKKAS